VPPFRCPATSRLPWRLRAFVGQCHSQHVQLGIAIGKPREIVALRALMVGSFTRQCVVVVVACLRAQAAPMRRVYVRIKLGCDRQLICQAMPVMRFDTFLLGSLRR
jgi:hypothetical protein